jgi:NADP-dependent 3-hydroxy acid dehydrogenase YdfG
VARFSEQTFLVTGTSGGVGEAIATRLGEEAATVWLSGRNRERLQAISARFSDGRGHAFPADLTVEDELQSLVRAVLARSQRLDGIIHCAAVIALNNFASATRADFERQFQANVMAPYRLTQLLRPALIASRGQVLFLNSTSGLQARAEVSQYAATKHALRAVADSLREECNPSGVRVTSLYLGATATPMQAAIRARRQQEYDPALFIQPHDIALLAADILALPRTAEVTDLTIRPMAKV